jgi:hypothetical protein
MKLDRAICAASAGMFLCSAIFQVQAANPYKNLAVNPNDVQDAQWTAAKGYPHATSNSEYPAPLSQPPSPQYCARNAIDGKTANTVETRDPSWGPNKIQGIWWKVAFGKQVQIDSVVIWIRADWSTTGPVPHDSYWKSGTLVFSDSSKVNIKIDSTAKSQGFKFTSRVTNSLTLTNLVANADRWCALAELQAWGYANPTPVKRSPLVVSATPVGKSNALCFLPGFSSVMISAPASARVVEIYTLEGKMVWAGALKGGTGKFVTTSIPRTIARGIYRINYLTQ